MDRWNQVGAKFKFVEDKDAVDGLSAHYRDYDNGLKALTRLTPIGPNSSLSTFDISINIHFAFNPAHPNQYEAGTGQPYDLESIVAHELGHVLFLKHLTDPSDAAELMYFDVGTTPKPLGPGDCHGILSLYP